MIGRRRIWDVGKAVSKKLFIFGLGYVAEHLGRRLIAEGWQVSGTTRSAEKAERLKAQGFKIAGTDNLAGASHVLVSVPPGAGDKMALEAVAHNLITRANNPEWPKWIGYLSSTSVYGSGGPFDEGAPTRPGSKRGQARLMAEAGWRDLDIPLHIFRLAGIYGPGRNVLDGLKAGSARCIYKDGHVFCRIHVDDIVAVLLASISRPEKAAIYNIADDEPAAQAEVILYGAKLLGISPPQPEDFATAELSDALRDFYSETRTINADRIKSQMHITLQYPDYRAGLSALFADAQHQIIKRGV
jgi:nucleoside-diphosphate-sugar epimerase